MIITNFYHQQSKYYFLLGKLFPSIFGHQQSADHKLGWSLVANEDKHWVRILKSKYLKGSLFSTPSSCSWLWKKILNTRDLLKLGTCSIIGNGEHTSVWDDPCIPTLENFIPTPTIPNPTNIHRVSDLISPTTHQWDRDKIFSNFDHTTAGKILNIHLTSPLSLDQPCWTPCSSDTISVKYAYLTNQQTRFSSTGSLSHLEWKSLWKAKINARHKLMLWKIAWDILPTTSTLATRIHSIIPSCVHCNAQKESSLHLLTTCPFAQSI